jgi:hypothetical protein
LSRLCLTLDGVKRKKGNRLYCYLVESARVDGKPRIVPQAYLGTAEKPPNWSSKGPPPIPLSATLRDFGLPGPCGWLPNSPACGPYWNPAAKLRVDIANSIAVGDSVWDLLAAGERGRWEWEFHPAGMGRMNWSAPALITSTRTRHLLKHLDELGVRTPA